MKYRLILILVLLIVACSKPNNPPNDGLVVSFRITDDAGDKVTEFRLGEEIFFEFSVINRTGEDQAWSSAYYWPVARFALYRDSVVFGATYETTPLGILPHEGVLKNGDTLHTVASWFDHSWHAPPPVGEYTAFAILNYSFDDLKSSREWPIDFTITPPAAGSEEVFAWYRRSAFGFCVPAERVYYGSVVRTADGVYTLSGTKLLDMSIVTMPCVNYHWTDPCLYQVSFDDRVLTGEESTELERLLTALPIEEHQIDPVCDPCLIDHYYIRGRLEEVNPCASGSEEFIQVAAEIDTLINDLMPHD